MADWNPTAYARFADLRLRPALDLLAQLGDVAVGGGIVDLGCGTGVVGPALRERFAGARITGVDTSPAMLEKAAARKVYDWLDKADLTVWRPATGLALIYSNAALQWVGGHGRLLPQLAAMLAPGGQLAVQMPRQFSAPSHRFLRDFAADMFPDRFDFSGWLPPVDTPLAYHRLLSPLGRVSVWETEYLQRLDPSDAGHPVRRFTESTAMRPFIDKLTAAEAADFVRRYDQALTSAYPEEPDGGVLFPFRRLFLTLTVPE